MWVNYDDVLDQVRELGILVDALVVDSPRPVRCQVEGGGREKKGWYWVSSVQFDDGPYVMGAAGVWAGTDNGRVALKVRRDKKAVALDRETRQAAAAQVRAQLQALKVEQEALWARAASRASEVWRRCAVEGRSGYLAKKKVEGFGVRFSPSTDAAVVPMVDVKGRVWGLQVLRGDDARPGQLAKEFWPRGVCLEGRFHLIGASPRPGAVVVLTEGFATGASIHQATGLPVVVAFTANNLLPVAQAITKAWRPRVLVAADDDYLQRCPLCKAVTPVDAPLCQHCGEAHGLKNPGVVAAGNAARAVHGEVLVPVFAAPRPLDVKGGFTDFNDLALAEGVHVVRAQVEGRLVEVRWDVKAPAPAPALDQTVVNGVVLRPQMPSVLSLDEALDRYVFVYGGNGTFFDAVEHCLVPKADVQAMLPDHGWRDLMAHKRVVRLSEVGFDPTNSDVQVRCNLWGGWPTQPRAGSCDALLDLLAYLCDATAQPEVYEWVLRWLAYPIQHPGAKMRTALVMHGPQGAGKNIFFEAVMAIYGEYGRVIDQAALEDKFNDWASRKLFLVADEVVARQELYHLKNKEKSLVTGDWIRINSKHVAAHNERNHINLVFLSNESQPLALEKDDRRHAVIWTPAALPAYVYAEVGEEVKQGGVAALHHFLATMELGDFGPHTKPPHTAAKETLIEAGLDSVERFVREWMAGQVELNQTPLPFCPCGSSDLYAAYQRWCRVEGVSRPREQNQFVTQVLRRTGWERAHKDRYESYHLTGKPKRQRFVLPATADLERFAPQFLPPPDQTQTVWLTHCFLAFSQALESFSQGGVGFAA